MHGHLQARKGQNDSINAAAASLQLRSALLFTGSALVEAMTLYSYGIHDPYRLWERNQVRGLAGQDISFALENTADKTRAWWESLSQSEKEENFNKLYNGLRGWDITPLPKSEQVQRSSFAIGNDNWARRSVTVQGKAFYAHEVNYFFWGFIHRLAEKDGLDTSRTSMLNWVRAYRVLGDSVYNIARSDHGGMRIGRLQWADAGWDYADNGWYYAPAVAALHGAEPNTDTYNSSLSTLFIDGDIVVLTSF